MGQSERNGGHAAVHSTPPTFTAVVSPRAALVLQGSRSVREAMLRDFLAQCTQMTAPELETQFCDCASLFLARVIVWLRLDYLHGPLVLQLKSISVFLSAASG